MPKERKLFVHMQADPPSWTRLQLGLLAVILVLGALQMRGAIGRGHLGRLGASGETAQGSSSCQAVGEQHGLDGVAGRMGCRAVVSTPVVLV